MADGIEDLLAGPESAAVKFIGTGVDGAVIDGFEDVDQFFLYFAFKDVVAHRGRIRYADAKFFHHLTAECLLNGLAV